MYGHPSRQINLADNRRTRVKAAIKLASKRGRQSLRKLDRDMEQQLEQAYRTAADEIRIYLQSRAGDDNTLRLEVMRDLLDQSDARLALLEADRNGLLDQGLTKAANIGVRPFYEDAVNIGASLTKVADDAVRFTVSMQAADGLQLSDRLWAIDNGAREVVGAAIQRHIIQGHSASQAAQEFLNNGEPIPAALRDKIGLANADRIGRVVGRELMTGDDSAYANARRVFRTEINRAHGEAYQASGFEHPEVIGTRFLLSPLHPKTDICDMHARVNRYGLGAGVYPKDRNPWPAHPNTLSFVEVVFDDEVTDEDRNGKETRIEWLNRQDAAVQANVLGARSKQSALRQGALKENEIATPWRVLKKRYARRGVDITGAIPSTKTGAVTLPDDDGIIIKTSVPRDFPIGETPKQATDITRKLVQQGNAYDYPKDGNGEYLVRFRHGPKYRPDHVRGKKYNQANTAKFELGMTNAINKLLHETGQVSDQLGIPRLRGVNPQAGVNQASMGDGILAIHAKYNNRHFKPGMKQHEAISIYEKDLKQKQAGLRVLEEDKATYSKSSYNTLKNSYRESIIELERRLKKLRDGVPVEAVTRNPSDWTPGSSKIQPHLSDAYFSLSEDKFKSTVWHEYGHHIHQQIRVNDRIAYASPPLEKELFQLYKKPGRIFPTRYSKTNSKEWFAESYSLYRMGRSDLLDKDLLALIHKIESGGYIE